jgi:hypothetical protein
LALRHLAESQMVKCHLSNTVMVTRVDWNILSAHPISNVTFSREEWEQLTFGQMTLAKWLRPNDLGQRLWPDDYCHMTSAKCFLPNNFGQMTSAKWLSSKWLSAKWRSIKHFNGDTNLAYAIKFFTTVVCGLAKLQVTLLAAVSYWHKSCMIFPPEPMLKTLLQP